MGQSPEELLRELFGPPVELLYDPGGCNSRFSRDILDLGQHEFQQKLFP
jgi:hypothetical protein